MIDSFLKKIDDYEEISENSNKYLIKRFVDLKCETEFFELTNLTQEFPINIPDPALISILYGTHFYKPNSIKILKEGGFAKVFDALKISDDMKIVLKVQIISYFESMKLKLFEEEINLNREIQKKAGLFALGFSEAILFLSRMVEVYACSNWKECLKL